MLKLITKCFFQTLVIIFIATASSSPASAQSETPPPMPLEEQERLELMQKALDSIETLETSLNRATNEKKNHCMKAIGVTEFCDCITKNSPVGISFIQYVAIAASTREDMNYEKMSKDDKAMFDAVRASRDKCVNWSGKKAK